MIIILISIVINDNDNVNNDSNDNNDYNNKSSNKYPRITNFEKFPESPHFHKPPDISRKIKQKTNIISLSLDKFREIFQKCAVLSRVACTLSMNSINRESRISFSVLTANDQ
jgi:hypothetical protein